MARPALLLGVNQTVNLALGIVVIAALVGAEGLGQVVLTGLQNLLSPDGGVGLAFAGGLAIVAIALVFDRMTRGRSVAASRAVPAEPEPRAPARRAARGRRPRGGRDRRRRRRSAPGSFPTSVHWDIVRPINDAVEWIKDNVEFLQTISDFVVTKVLTPMRDFLTDAPWWAVAGAVDRHRRGRAAAGGSRRRSRSARCSSPGSRCPPTPRASGTTRWTRSRQVLVAVVLAMAIALPVGIIAGRSPRFDAAIRPLLDAMQVMPAFVYLVPVVALFAVGRFPGIVASMVYAIPIGIRLTALGIREVPPTTIEAAESMGAGRWQVLTQGAAAAGVAVDHARREPDDPAGACRWWSSPDSSEAARSASTSSTV